MTNEALNQVFQIAADHHQRGALAEAARIYAQILEIDPSYGPALKSYGVLLCQAGEFVAGAEILGHATTVMPHDAEAWSNLGNALRILEQSDEAIRACERAVELDPGQKFALNNLSAALRQASRIGESIEAARRALQIDPDFVDAAINLASGHQAAGEIEEALSVLQRVSGASEGLRDNLLFTSLYSDAISEEEITRLHVRQASRPEPLPKSPSLKRIGFVSGDLRAHPVGKFLLPLLKEIVGLEVVLYASQIFDDEVSAELRGAATGWRNVYGQSAEAVAEMVRSDGIDILIDLAGHSALNRLDVFRLRCAPMQVTYLGYSATTGEPNMDWILADEVLIPQSSEHLYTERVARMPVPFLTGKITPSPRRVASPHIRFSSFNNPAKMSPTCLDAWAEILRRVPESTLLLKYKFFESDYVAERFLREFSQREISAERIVTLGHDTAERHAARFGEIDIALDTFPYTGATTTMDALSRGIPTITYAGPRYVSRMSASLLAALDMPELIATSTEEYVEIAVSLALSTVERERIATRILDQFPSSPLVDGKTQAANFAAALHGIWTDTN